MSLIKRQQCKVINDFININSGLIFNKDSEIGQIQLLTWCAINAVSRIELVSNQCHVSSKHVSRKAWHEPQTLEYSINCEIYTPYADGAAI